MEGVEGGAYLVNGVMVDATGKPLDVTVQDTDFSTLSKDDLVKLAEEKGLDASGTKADIAARLKAAE